MAFSRRNTTEEFLMMWEVETGDSVFALPAVLHVPAGTAREALERTGLGIEMFGGDLLALALPQMQETCVCPALVEVGVVMSGEELAIHLRNHRYAPANIHAFAAVVGMCPRGMPLATQWRTPDDRIVCVVRSIESDRIVMYEERYKWPGGHWRYVCQMLGG